MTQTPRCNIGKFFLAFIFFVPSFIATGRVVFNTELIKISELKNYSIDENIDINDSFEKDNQNDEDLPIKISEVKNYSTDENRDIYSSFEEDGQKDQGLPLDPFDLMNRLKKAGAMNDATTPSDALDEALNAFDQSEYKNVPIE